MNPPEKEQVEVPEAAVESALRATVPGFFDPACNLSLEERGRAVERIRKALQAAAPALCAQERERLGLVECPNCDDGWVDNGPIPGCCGRPRNGECCGEPEPTPDFEPCPTCGGTQFVPRNLRAAVDQAAQQERERVKEVLERLWARAEEEKQKTATAFDERDKMAGDRQAADEAGLLDDFHRVLEELFPRCDGDGEFPVERGSVAGAVEDTEPCPGCPDCLLTTLDKERD